MVVVRRATVVSVVAKAASCPTRSGGRAEVQSAACWCLQVGAAPLGRTFPAYRCAHAHSACVEAQHALLKEVRTAGHSAGGGEARRYPFRSVRHCHRFSHLGAQPQRRQFVGG